MRYLLSIDDTDDLTKSTSTGYIASQIAKVLSKEYNLKVKNGVSRHQLLLEEGVPYTSHNSTMCIDIEGDMAIEEIEEIAETILYKHMASTASPGICICNVDLFEEPKVLMDFGRRAKEFVLTKKEAHQLCESRSHIIAKELGGEGNGIIGAVAGVGLRLSGNDGTFRGKIHLKDERSTISVKDLKDRFNLDDIVNLSTKKPLNDDEIITNEDPAKIFLREGKCIVFAYEKEDGTYILCDRQKSLQMGKYCKHFEPDNDFNECISAEKRCENCLYRRFTENGFKCIREGANAEGVKE